MRNSLFVQQVFDTIRYYRYKIIGIYNSAVDSFFMRHRIWFTLKFSHSYKD